MKKEQKQIAQSLLELALDLGHHYSYSSHTKGVYLFREPDCKATDTLYLDKEYSEVIKKYDQIIEQAYDL